MDVNVLGIARVTKRFFRLLRENPSGQGGDAGRVVNVASVAGCLGPRLTRPVNLRCKVRIAPTFIANLLSMFSYRSVKY